MINTIFYNNRLLFLSLFLLSDSALSSVDKAAQFPIRMTVVDSGIYQLLDKGQQAFIADSTAGYGSVINTKLLSESNTVPLRQGVVFGFNFAITDTTTEAQWVPVLIQIKHPQTTNYLGRSSVGFSKTSSARLKADGSYRNGAFYVLSEPYEMVAGEWQIAVIYRDEIVVSRTFIVGDTDGR